MHVTNEIEKNRALLCENNEHRRVQLSQECFLLDQAEESLALPDEANASLLSKLTGNALSIMITTLD